MRSLFAVALALLAVPAWAQEYDEYNARDIMRTCAACHGEFGEGGGGGVYPRLAGLHPEYLADQMNLFKTRERENIPMIPYATERELPEKDVYDVAMYLSAVKLKTKLPPADPTEDGYARLQLAKQVLQIPREPGDAEAGKAWYDKDCAACHGNVGQGRVKRPPLAGQHIKYLRAQMEHFQAGRRKHPDLLELMGGRSAEDIQNLLAFLSILDDE